VRGNGNPLAPPSPDTEPRVAAHLRRARGKSPVFLARRYRLALTGYIAAVSQAGEDHDHLGDYADLDARVIVALKLCGLVAKERARFAATAHPRAHRPRTLTASSARAWRTSWRRWRTSAQGPSRQGCARSTTPTNAPRPTCSWLTHSGLLQSVGRWTDF
jgi:hypothetical protein